MMPLFEMPEILTLDGNPFKSILEAGEPGVGYSCGPGCTSGCCAGCDVGSGKGVAIKPPVG